MKQLITITVTSLLFITPHAIQGDQNSENIGAFITEYSQNFKGWPMLHYAIAEERPDVAEIALEIYPEQADQLTPPLELMDFHMGNTEKGDYDYNVGWEEGYSALELAFMHHNPDLALTLLEHSKEDLINRRHKVYDGFYRDSYETRTGYASKPNKFVGWLWKEKYQESSLLYWTLELENQSLFKKLLNYNPSLYDCLTISQKEGYPSYTLNVQQYSSFSLAARKETDFYLKELIHLQKIQIDADFDEEVCQDILDVFRSNWSNEYNWPALHYAVQMNDLESFGLLLDWGTDPTWNGSAPESLISMATKHPNIEFLQRLLEELDEADLAARVAIENGDVDRTIELINTYEISDNLLLTAVKNQKNTIVRLLLEHGFHSPEAFSYAIQNNQLETVSLLIDYKHTYPHALSIAIEYHHPELFSLLLEKGFFHPGCYSDCITHNTLEMLKQIISTHGVGKEELGQLIRQAADSKRGDILTYLLSLKPNA